MTYLHIKPGKVSNAFKYLVSSVDGEIYNYNQSLITRGKESRLQGVVVMFSNGTSRQATELTDITVIYFQNFEPVTVFEVILQIYDFQAYH